MSCQVKYIVLKSQFSQSALNRPTCNSSYKFCSPVFFFLSFFFFFGLTAMSYTVERNGLRCYWIMYFRTTHNKGSSFQIIQNILSQRNGNNHTHPTLQYFTLPKETTVCFSSRTVFYKWNQIKTENKGNNGLHLSYSLLGQVWEK